MKLFRGWLMAYHGWWVIIVSKHPVPWVIAIGVGLLGGMIMFENLHLPLWIALGIWAAIAPGLFAAMSVISGKNAKSDDRKAPISKKHPQRGARKDKK